MERREKTETGTFRDHLPDLSSHRFKKMQGQDAREYAAFFLNTATPPWLHSLYLHWRKLFMEPFKGITTDGHVRSDVFELEDQGAPIEDIVHAARLAILEMSPEQREATHYHIDSPEWRSWSNPEFLLSDKGVRLDEVSDGLRDAIMDVLRASLSPEGYQKALAAMRINGFLGDLVNSPAVMNQWSYNFVLFGHEPSVSRPWGLSFYGHHLCLNIFFYKRQMVLSPWFTGAEPNMIDHGPHSGTIILKKEETLGLQLMQSLPEHVQKLAQIYKLMRDPEMLRGRWNHDDQRHLCGAFRDNRVVPYEGVLVSSLTKPQQILVTAIFEQYLIYLPERVRNSQLDNIKRWYGETYFCWIGGFGDSDPFYYRLQSPVIIVEFDHHSGVFLTNKEPAKFHVHTLLRTPNGGDYGMALRGLVPGLEQDFVWEDTAP